LRPSTVTLAAPVDGPFAETIPETDTATAVKADETLPTCTPAVTTAVGALPDTTAALHDTALEDVHAVDA
jgi:hypothetical protein